MIELPLIDDVYIRGVFDKLSHMDVDLDSDPLIFGPKRLNAKVAHCREHLSRCQQIYLQLADDLHKLGRAHRQAKCEFEILMQDLLANDPEVRSQKNIRDREAVASSKLRAERETMFRIETSITDLESVVTVVKAKKEDLKDIQCRIRDQVKLCQEEIGLGLRWGSAPSPGVDVNLSSHPLVNTKALTELNETVGGIDGELSISDLDKFVREEVGEAPVSAPSFFSPVEKKVTKADPVKVEAVLSSIKAAIVEPEPDIEKIILPLVEKKVGPVFAATTTMNEVDDFFSDVDVTPAKKVTQAVPPVSDVDLDDLIGLFEG